MEHTVEVADIIIFIGRFHPLIVHFPIGFLFIGMIMHFASKNEKYVYLNNAVPFALALGAIGAVLSCILGYMLSLQGGYNLDTLNNHKWMGLLVALIAILTFGITVWKRIENSSYLYSAIMLILFIGLGIAGHLGGNLTHGSTYLTQYAPEPLRKIAGLPPKEKERPPVAILDSADIFLDVVKPILRKKCISCHGHDKRKGDLMLNSFDLILKGGKNKNTVVAGNLEKSELINRITLPIDHEDYMPPEGKTPLSKEEINVLKIWILNGANPSGIIAGMNLINENKSQIANVLGLNPKKESELLKKVPPGNTEAINSLIAQGFIIKTLSNTSNLLDVKLNPGKSITKKNLEDLVKLREQLVWLDVSDVNITDEDLTTISKLESLQLLNLNSNPITDEGLKKISTLKNLTTINLYGTKITNQGLNTLEALPKLKKIYAWKTLISPDEVLEVKKRKPYLVINIG